MGPEAQRSEITRPEPHKQQVNMLHLKPWSLPVESSVFIPLDSEANNAPQKWFSRERCHVITSDEEEKR